mgnify:CR=1 FL=1
MSITIKKEKLPERCEICHQKDYFNPINNYCKRCSLSSLTTSDNYNFIIDQSIINLRLPNVLRNFSWQNQEVKLLSSICRIFVFTTFLSVFLVWVNEQIAQDIDSYYIPPLPGSQTEDFTMWGYISHCGGSPTPLEMVFISVMGFCLIGIFYLESMPSKIEVIESIKSMKDDITKSIKEVLKEITSIFE